MNATRRVLAESRGSRSETFKARAKGESESGNGVGSQYLMVRFSCFASLTQGPTFAEGQVR